MKDPFRVLILTLNASCSLSLWKIFTATSWPLQKPRITTPNEPFPRNWWKQDKSIIYWKLTNWIGNLESKKCNSGRVQMLTSLSSISWNDICSTNLVGSGGLPQFPLIPLILPPTSRTWPPSPMVITLSSS